MPRQVCGWWKKLKSYLQNLNLFPSVPPSTDEYELRTQRISTKLFIVIHSIILINLLLYTSIIRVPKTIYVEAPSFTQYALLNSTYSETLTCPCSNISINYEKFLHVKYTFHQVCSSIFVDQTWIEYLSRTRVTNRNRGDFRHVSPYAFQTLKTFCELINRTISDSLIQFYSNQYISAYVIPEHVFKPETELLIQEFRSSVKNTFSLSLEIIRDTTEANALLSALQTNYYIFIDNTIRRIVIINTIYGDCKCSSSAKCVDQSVMYDYPNLKPLFNVSDFYIGCYMIEALLQSTLKCFYNQSCIDKLEFYISSSVSMNITALDASLPTRYSVNTTIQELVDDLMIEKWNGSTMYERYYNQCQPTQCSYVIETRNDVIHIFTTLFGIIGGLTTVLMLIIPRLVKLIRKKREQQQPDNGKKNRNSSVVF